MAEPTDKVNQQPDAQDRAGGKKPLVARSSGALGYATGWPGAVAVGIAFWILIVSSLSDKCTTYDEIYHVTQGYAYWKQNDYRLDVSVNLNLPQRIMALPVMLGGHEFPSLDQQAWWSSDNDEMGKQFFYEMGNDADAILMQGRAIMAVLAAAGGLLVYGWSRRLFGPGGGMISLLLYVLSPTVLANGALMHNDMAGALLLLASVGCLWALLQRISPLRVLLSGLVLSGLFLSKMSAPVIVPIALGMIVLQMIVNKPLVLSLARWKLQLTTRLSRGAAYCGLVLIHVAVVFAMIWASFGLRYEAMNNPRPGRDQPAGSWEKLLDESDPRVPATVTAGLTFAKDNRLLPEAYLRAMAKLFSGTRDRAGFLHGEFRTTGWRVFFPYTFAIKTPLTILAAVLIAICVALAKWFSLGARSKLPRGRWLGGALYRTAPLWLLLVVYWAMAINSELNIGHRHILPVYPPMFILAGAAVYWFKTRRRAACVLLAGALTLLAGETLYRYPNYLAYFNQLIGGPANGYKYLIDSSLDWGQDLPALKRYLDGRGLGAGEEGAVYLYYGAKGNPAYYGIRTKPTDRLAGGVYCVSATSLQSLFVLPGRWNALYEDAYQKLHARIRPLLEATDADKRRALTVPGRLAQWRKFFIIYASFRRGRLTAYMRRRGPDDNVNYTILIYNLSDAEVKEALTGPSPEEPNDYDRPELVRPGHAIVYARAASAYMAMGLYDQAIEQFTTTVKVDPRYIRAYRLRAVCYLRLKQYDKAWADVQNCRDLGAEPTPGLVKALTEASGRSQ